MAKGCAVKERRMDAAAGGVAQGGSVRSGSAWQRLSRAVAQPGRGAGRGWIVACPAPMNGDGCRGYERGMPMLRAMTMRCTSLLPSPISHSLTSRNMRSTG